MKLRPVGADLFHVGWRGTDSWRDMMKPNSPFRNFPKAPTKVNIFAPSPSPCHERTDGLRRNMA